MVRLHYFVVPNIISFLFPFAKQVLNIFFPFPMSTVRESEAWRQRVRHELDAAQAGAPSCGEASSLSLRSPRRQPPPHLAAQPAFLYHCAGGEKGNVAPLAQDPQKKVRAGAAAGCTDDRNGVDLSASETKQAPIETQPHSGTSVCSVPPASRHSGSARGTSTVSAASSTGRRLTEIEEALRAEKEGRATILARLEEVATMLRGISRP